MSYDDQGRLTGLTNALPDGSWTDSYTVTWSDDGLTSTMTGSSMTQVVTKDAHGNILHQETTYPAMDLLMVYTYTYKAIEISADSPRIN